MSRRTVGLLLTFYPRAWRRRYGDELTQLIADLEEEEPRSGLRNTLDIVRSLAPVHVAWHPALPSVIVFLVGGSVATFAITTHQAPHTIVAAQQAGGSQVLIIPKPHKTYVSRGDFTWTGTGSTQVVTVTATPLGGRQKVTLLCRASDCLAARPR